MAKILIMIVFIMLLLGTGCGKEGSKVEIPKNMEITKLSDILKNPAYYHNKKVLLNGFVNSVCPSGCEIVYQEGKNTIKIYPKKSKFPLLKNGTPIKVYAEITAGKERIIITVLKLEVVK